MWWADEVGVGFFFYCYAAHRDLHSFPTRRSSDLEVYEHLVFEGEHIPLATLPGMRERTLTISSGGKTFSFTGWKVGWVCGPAELVTAVRAVKQFLRSEEHTSELQSLRHLVCRLLL